MTDFPEIPPAGRALLLATDVHLTRDADERAGLFLARDGRLVIAAGRVGLGVHLSATDAAALGAALRTIGRVLARQERAATADADALLHRAAAGGVQ